VSVVDQQTLRANKKKQTAHAPARSAAARHCTGQKLLLGSSKRISANMPTHSRYVNQWSANKGMVPLSLTRSHSPTCWVTAEVLHEEVLELAAVNRLEGKGLQVGRHEGLKGSRPTNQLLYMRLKSDWSVSWVQVQCRSICAAGLRTAPQALHLEECSKRNRYGRLSQLHDALFYLLQY
jgi:hypothetical protein